MSKVADSIRRGLEEAISYAKGQADLSAYRVHIPDKVDVKGDSNQAGDDPAVAGLACRQNA